MSPAFSSCEASSSRASQETVVFPFVPVIPTVRSLRSGHS